MAVFDSLLQMINTVTLSATSLTVIILMEETVRARSCPNAAIQVALPVILVTATVILNVILRPAISMAVTALVTVLEDVTKETLVRILICIPFRRTFVRPPN